jgi:hypothetical protein
MMHPELLHTSGSGLIKYIFKSLQLQIGSGKICDDIDKLHVRVHTFSMWGRVNHHIYYNILLSESRIPNISRTHGSTTIGATSSPSRIIFASFRLALCLTAMPTSS